jgi:hypothetical protein
VIDPVTTFVGTLALTLIAATIVIAFRSRNKLHTSQDHVIWWLPVWVVLGGGGVLLSLMMWSAHAPLLYMLLIAPAVCFVCFLFLIAAAIRQRPRQILSAVLTLVGFVAISWGLDRNEGALRPFLRWLLWSRDYKTELRTQPDPRNGELKHVVWDTWGFVPTGFDVVYLVFDPADSLANAAKSKVPGRFGGIPCEVPRVRRLEAQWYAVEFYTDEEWGNCPFSDRGTR